MRYPDIYYPENFKPVIEVNSIRQDRHRVELEVLTADSVTASVVLIPVNRFVWNLRFIPSGVEWKPLTEVVNPEYLKQMKCMVRENEEFLFIKAGDLDVHIRKNPWFLQLKNQNDDTILRENPADVNGLGERLNFPLGLTYFKEKVSATAISFYLSPEECLYGLGEKFSRLNKAGQRIISWTCDALGANTEFSHKSIPFLISSRGYGLFLNSSARSTWELGSRSFTSYNIINEMPFLDLYIIYGPTPRKILYEYSQLTGPPEVPPAWSFGTWLSSAGTHRDQKSVRELVYGLEKYGIPADVIHIDTWWMRWRRYCDFIWDSEAFPDVDKLIREIREKDLKISLWIQPYISVESDLFAEGKKKDFFAKRPDGNIYVIDYGLSLAPRPDGVVRKAEKKEGWNAPVAIIDFTNQKAIQWLKNLARPLLKQGIDVFKTDFGEDIPEDAVFSDGRTGTLMHNLYPLLYNKIVYEVVKQEKGDGLVWARSGFAGSQRYPLCWSGDPAADWESLATTIRGGLSAGLSGILFWSHDIGGYRGMPSAELYVRWAQFGLFCSHSRMHGDGPREPWHFGEKAVSIVRKYIHLRYQLFPYLYSTALEARRTGLPVIRAMILEFPEDLFSRNQEFQYMLGPWLLVAPVYQPGGRIDIYLPAGEWTDFFTGKSYQGPANVTLKVPLHKLPIYVRSGAILPMMKKSIRIPEKKIDPIILKIYPSRKTRYVFKEKERNTVFTCLSSREKIVLRIAGNQIRDYFLRFYHINSYKSIRLWLGEQEKNVNHKNIIHRKKYLQIRLQKIKKAQIIIEI